MVAGILAGEPDGLRRDEAGGRCGVRRRADFSPLRAANEMINAAFQRSPQTLAVIEKTTRLGIAFVPFFALAGAAGGRGRAAETNPAVTELAKARGVTEAQVRLAWTLHQGPNVLAIPGAGDIGHLEDNVAAADIHFTQEEPDALDT